MAYGEGGLTASDVSLLTRNNNGFGEGMGSWWIIIFLIFAFMGFGNNRGTNGAMDNYVLASDFSQLARQMSDGFNSQERKLDGVNNGLCDGFYAQAQLVNGVNQNISNGVYNLSNAITSNGYETRIGVNGIGTQLASCCCEVKEGIQGINFNNAQNTCAITQAINSSTRDIVDNQNANYRALHDEIVANRLEDKNAQITAQQNEINALRLSASQQAQNAYLVNQLAPKIPVPAFITCNPFTGQTYSSCCNA